MQVSVSSAAASAVSGAASSGAAGSVSGAAGQSAGKTDHTTSANPQTGSSDNASFEQAYTQAGTSVSALETESSGEQSVPGDLLPSDTPTLEQLAQWLQAQPDPAQALETVMQQLGLSAGQQGELTQALAAALRVRRRA